MADDTTLLGEYNYCYSTVMASKATLDPSNPADLAASLLTKLQNASYKKLGI